MKKLALIFCLFPLLNNAQITISDADMLQSGDMFFYSRSIDFSSVDVSLTGANYNWDYSAISMNNQDTLAAIAVTSTPLAYQFYFNNQFVYPEHKADYAIVGRDINAFGQVTINERDDFYKVNSNSLEVTGFGANVNGIPTSVKYDTIDQIYPLPMTYGTTDSTSAYYIVTIPSFGTYGQWIRRKVEVDGWGSISTPYTTYSNTIRVKTTLYQKDTMYVDQFSFGTNLDRPVETIYEWYEVGSGAPVFKATENAGNLTEVKYLDVITSSIDEQGLYNLKIYPNPVTETLTINFDNVLCVTIYDIQGQIMKKYTDRRSVINVKDFPKGVYLLDVFNGEESRKCKFIKE